MNSYYYENVLSISIFESLLSFIIKFYYSKPAFFYVFNNKVVFMSCCVIL